MMQNNTKQQAQKQQPQVQKTKKPGVYDQLWQALIRPPNRFIYTKSDLGPQNFIVQKTVGSREDFQIYSSQGHMLECSYFESRYSHDMPHPCVIYLHGNSSSRVEGISLIEYLIPYDISLVLMDFSGCGLSQGEYISLGFFEKLDVCILMDHLKKNKPITKFGLWGRSMGASTAIQVGCMRNDIEIVVADSSFLNIRQLCQEVAKRQYSNCPKFVLSMAFYFIRKKIKKKANFDINECNTLTSVQNPTFKPAILFLAAKGDQLISYKHSVQLFESYKGSKNIMLFEGNHNTKRPKNTLKEISIYFRSNLYEFGKMQLKPETLETEILQTEQNEFIQKQQKAEKNQINYDNKPQIMGGINMQISQGIQQKQDEDEIPDFEDSISSSEYSKIPNEKSDQKDKEDQKNQNNQSPINQFQVKNKSFDEEECIHKDEDTDQLNINYQAKDEIQLKKFLNFDLKSQSQVTLNEMDVNTNTDKQ